MNDNKFHAQKYIFKAKGIKVVIKPGQDVDMEAVYVKVHELVRAFQGVDDPNPNLELFRLGEMVCGREQRADDKVPNITYAQAHGLERDTDE